MKREFEDIDDIQQRIQTIPDELPILPVRDAVIFPNAVKAIIDINGIAQPNRFGCGLGIAAYFFEFGL